mgnify:CR=1 FL=1
MGLFSKIKDLLVDDEEVYETKEVEVEEKEEEHKLPTFMRNKIEKEEEEKKILEEKTQKKEPIKENIPEIKKEEKKEKKFPFEFDDDDFIEPTRFSRVTVQKEKVVEKIVEPQPQPIVKPYGNKKELEKPKKFRPTPVISPVYGVLDKNYKTDEVVSKEEDSYAIQRSSKKVDFEAVRKKAYGTLSDDIKNNMLCENCELLKEIKVSKKIERLSEEDLLYNMTVDDEDEVKKEDTNKDITLEQAKENYEDFGVTYELPPKRSRDDDEVKIVNHAEEEVVGEKVEVTEPVIEKENKNIVIEEEKKEDKKSELELTDDLFNLIDSMYKERDE